MAQVETGHAASAGAGVTGVEARLEQALAAFEAGRAALAAGITVEPLPGGVDNAARRVRSAAGDWVVRLGGARDDTFLINRVAERQAHVVAAAHGLAPAIVHVDPAGSVLITEFLGAAPWSRPFARSPEGIRLLGARLRDLHALPPPRAVRRIDVHAVLLHYLGLPQPAAGPVPRDEITARLRWSLATYVGAPAVFCHNDLHHANLIGESPLRFIDWEYAGVGDPLFELAAVISYQDYDEAQRSALLEAYGGAVDLAQLKRMSLVFDCLHALWLDAAQAWDALEAERRRNLLDRLAPDPAIQPLGRRRAAVVLRT